VDPNLPNLHATTDPRRSGGDIAGPGGPYERDGVIIDTTDAVLLDFSTVSTVELHRPNESEVGFAMMLEGRVNKSSDRSRVVYLLNADGAAALVTELLGLAKRAENIGDRRLADKLRKRLGERWDEMPS
jgi:hypothetical protein